ncbi:MAG TPA: hypothetical protein VFM79_13775, partial [Pelobium sp.]|nr:hypothetical protein [Pelobium sp.]
GNDPYIYSTTNLGIDASTIKTLKIRVKNTTNQSNFQIYWITNADQTYNGTKLAQIAVTPNSASQKEYIFDFSSITAWQGTIKQLRFDPGNPASGSALDIDYIKLVNEAYTLELANSSLKLKVDLLRGGAISYLSKATDNKNLINIYDRGRYVQQSYYAGANINRTGEGQHPSWSPWNWNPIQVGDVYNNSSVVLESQVTANSIYTKTQPLLWDMNNELAQCQMEMTVTLNDNTAHVSNKLTVFRTDDKWTAIPRHQELPAVYIIGDLNNLYTYKGTNAWTSEPAEKLVTTGPPWSYWTNPEHWAALLDANKWGVGVYNGLSTHFIGGYSGSAGGGANSSSTGYMSPLRTETLGKNTVYQYEYDLILGTLDEIRSFAYQKNGYTLPVTMKDFSATKKLNLVSLKWETLSEKNVKEFVLEKSFDGKSFSPVYVINAKGNSDKLVAYTYDDDLEEVTVYYRVVTYDNDGSSNFSKIIAVNGIKEADFTIAKSGTNQISIRFAKSFSCKIQVVDIGGKILIDKDLNVNKGLYSIDLNNYPRGVVVVNIHNKQVRKTQKLIF